ncbi:MAG: hypothetical protein E5V65_17770, partial [Mesorhizobium sp.]
FDRRAGALFRALGLLAAGHLAAMIGILLPFGAMLTLIVWQRQIRIAAGLIVIAAGIFLLINRRHPRVLARIPPAQLALWSFAAATAHGAGLMLVPIYLGLCQAGQPVVGHQAAATLMTGNLTTAATVSVVHTAAMIASGGVIAVAVYRWLGPKFISQSWFNLDIVWAISLILVGGIGIASIGYAR